MRRSRRKYYTSKLFLFQNYTSIMNICETESNQCFWGTPTANIDWCEENYGISFYIAEFWNSLSSFVLVFYGLFGLYCAFYFKLDNAIKFANFALAVVGLGSVAFHATLLYEYQLMDELPMIYGIIAIAYLIFADAQTHPTFTKLLPYILGISSVVISVLMWNDPDEPRVLQIGYACQVVLIIFRSIWISITYPHTRNMFIIAFLCYGGGTICWLLDRFLCTWVQTFQLHAWWHNLTAYGTYCFILFGTFYRLTVIEKKKAAIKFSGLQFFPYVYPVDFYRKKKE